MAEKRIQRRLAAILAADVVGYSRMMREDETGQSDLTFGRSAQRASPARRHEFRRSGRAPAAHWG